MDKEKIINKLKNKTNLDYDICKATLEKVDYDILDAIVHLEEEGEINKPNISEYFTNENYKKNEITVLPKKQYKEYKQYKRENSGQRVIEFICFLIDKCNKIDFLVKKYDKTILKLPLTVIIVLLIFAFGVFVPAVFIGFFFDFQYRFEGEGMEDSKINEILMKISRYIKERKENRRDRK